MTCSFVLGVPHIQRERDAESPSDNIFSGEVTWREGTRWVILFLLTYFPCLVSRTAGQLRELSLKPSVGWERAERGPACRGVAGTRRPAGSGAVEGVPLFPVCCRSRWLPQRHVWDPHTALHQAGREEERVVLRTSGWSHCTSSDNPEISFLPRGLPQTSAL